MRGVALMTAIGNVGKEPEIKYNQGGEPIGIFSIAVNNSFQKKDGTKVEETTWIDVKVFGGQAKVVRDYVKKGAPIAIVGGKYKVEEYEGKRYPKVVVDNFDGKIVLLPSGKADASRSAAPTDPGQGEGFQATDDDVPF